MLISAISVQAEPFHCSTAVEVSDGAGVDPPAITPAVDVPAAPYLDLFVFDSATSVQALPFQVSVLLVTLLPLFRLATTAAVLSTPKP